jgi:hypothetical protein
MYVYQAFPAGAVNLDQLTDELRAVPNFVSAAQSSTGKVEVTLSRAPGMSGQVARIVAAHTPNPAYTPQAGSTAAFAVQVNPSENASILGLRAAIAALSGFAPVFHVDAGFPTLADGQFGYDTDVRLLYFGYSGTNIQVWPPAIGVVVDGATPYRLAAYDGSHNLGELAALGSSGDVLTSGGAGALPTWQAPAGGMAIGGAVGSGTAHQLLYVDASGNLAQVVNATSDGYTLTVSAGSAASALAASNAFFFADLCNQTGGIGYAGQFADATNTVSICDVANAITVAAGKVSILGTSGNSLAFQNAGATPANPAVPVGYVLVNVVGIGDCFVPVFQ